MKRAKNVPIKVAEDLGKGFGYDQVIIHLYDHKTGVQQVTTWGSNKEHCENAGLGGDAIKKLLKWEDGYSKYTDQITMFFKHFNQFIDERLAMASSTSKSVYEIVKSFVNSADKWTKKEQPKKS